MQIKMNEWEKLKIINNQLDNLKNTQLDKIKVPVGAFITFESEEGVQRMLNSNNIKILGETPEVEKAPEPSNIIWENREYSTFSRIIRGILVGLVALMIIAATFVVVILLKQKAVTANNKY